tara:strand:- start:926 stop:1456 length:531 start_codon:yes stop_codon:yes gene_type:complete
MDKKDKLSRGACFTKGRTICPSVMPRNKPKCDKSKPRCVERFKKYERQLAKDRANYKPIPKSQQKPIGRPPKPTTEKIKEIKEEYKEKIKDIKALSQKKFGYSNTKQNRRDRTNWEAKKKKMFRDKHKLAFPKAPPRKNQKKYIKKKTKSQPTSQPKNTSTPTIKKQTGSFILSFK